MVRSGSRPSCRLLATPHAAQMTRRENGIWDVSVPTPEPRAYRYDIKPYIESHYRVKKGRAHTAMAGLSMGGHQTLNAAIPHLEQFAYIGVYSSSLIGGFPDLMPRPPGATTAPPRMGPTAKEWSPTHAAKLSDASLKKRLQLFWFATGKDDVLLRHEQGYRGDVREARLPHGVSPDAPSRSWLAF